MIAVLKSTLRKYGSASVQKAEECKIFYEPQVYECSKSTVSAEPSRKCAVTGEYRKAAQCHFSAVQGVMSSMENQHLKSSLGSQT